MRLTQRRLEFFVLRLELQLTRRAALLDLSQTITVRLQEDPFSVMHRLLGHIGIAASLGRSVLTTQQ